MHGSDAVTGLEVSDVGGERRIVGTGQGNDLDRIGTSTGEALADLLELARLGRAGQ